VNRLIFAPKALTDLEEIHTYIAKDSLPAALRFIERLYNRCNSLVLHPRVGRKCDDLLPSLRKVREGDYLIFFRPITNGIEIYRVLHGKRHIEKLFEPPDA
jgi:toxin ParE1/3/4